MSKKISVFKTGVTLLLIIVFGTSSCAQQPKRAQQTAHKEQTKTVVMQKVKMPVDGMTCSACQSNVKKTIKSIDGVSDVEVNLEKRFAFFTYDPKKVKVESIQKAVNDKGYTAGKPQEVTQ
jgi:periplasmic mercuric ion binding protein